METENQEPEIVDCITMKSNTIPTIVHVSTAKTWRGGEQQISYLVEGMMNYRIKQWVFCRKGSALERVCKKRNWPFASCRLGFAFNPFAAAQLKSLCFSKKIDLIHVHDAGAHNMVMLAVLLFGNQIPIVVSRRVDFPIGKSFWSRWKYNHSNVRKIICVSNFIKNMNLPAITDERKLAVVYSGIDLERFTGHFKTNRLRTEFGIPEGIPLIANIAAIAPHKDYITFIQVAERVLQEKDCRFLIIGADGGLGKAIVKQIQEKGLPDKILLTGFRHDIDHILPEIDVLLFTSKTEGLGTTLLDAFAAGVPVVSTDAGGIPEIVDHEISGLVAGAGDADGLAFCVLRMLHDSKLCADLVAYAHRKVQLFAVRNMVENTRKLYAEVLKLRK